MVSLTLRCGAIRRSEDGFEFLLPKVTDKASRHSLCLDAEHTLSQVHDGGIAIGDMLKERTDGCQSDISCADAIVALLLQVIEEGEHDITVEFFKTKSAGGLACTIGSENQKESQGISVGNHRSRAGPSLGHQAVAGRKTQAGLRAWISFAGSSVGLRLLKGSLIKTSRQPQ